MKKDSKATQAKNDGKKLELTRERVKDLRLNVRTGINAGPGSLTTGICTFNRY